MKKHGSRFFSQRPSEIMSKKKGRVLMFYGSGVQGCDILGAFKICQKV